MSVNVFPARVIDLERYAETGILFSDFTDGTAAVGTYVCKFLLPVGFVIERVVIANVVGFAGDTSAVLAVGDGSDPDRLNTGTLNVFTTIGAIDGGVVSGVAVVATAFAPKLTITVATDWTAVSAGALDINVFGYKVI